MGDPVEPQQTETPVVNETPSPEPQVSEPQSSGNPAWEPVLNEIPAAFHSKVRPHLEEWERGVSKIHEKYAPFKQFVDNNVDPQRLSLGNRIVDWIDRDPAGFYREMEQKFRAAGYIQQAEQAAQKAEEVEEQEQESQQEFKDPRFDQFMQSLQEAQADMERQKAEAEADRQVEAELKEVEKLHGRPLDENLTRELILRASAQHDAAVSRGQRPPNLQQVYRDLMNFHAGLSKSSSQAPQVIPSGSGQPSPQQVNFKELANDKNARKQAALAFLQNRNGG